MCERVRVLCMPCAVSLRSMSATSVMCGEFARAWAMDVLSNAYGLACLFVPYLISCRLRNRERPLFIDFIPLSRAVAVLANAV